MAVLKLVRDRGAEWEEGNMRLYSKRKERENVRRGNVKGRDKRVRCDGLLGAWESESFGITDPSLFFFLF